MPTIIGTLNENYWHLNKNYYVAQGEVGPLLRGLFWTACWIGASVSLMLFIKAHQ
ncbi:hypothetical protein [Caudoviricetes sp.]|nr:hypothetical protein [Caudoviricetes sp.]